MKATPAGDVDVAVIGAGCAGLTAAALLAGSGLKVAVFEEQTRPGGCMQGFERGEFVFDTAIHWLNNCGPHGFVTRVLDHLGGDFPPALPLAAIRRYKGETFDYRLTREPRELLDRLRADFPAEAEGLTRLFADARELGQGLQLLDRRMRDPATRGVMGRLGFGLSMLAWYLPRRRTLRAGVEEGLARYFPTIDGVARLFAAEKQFISILTPLSWGYSGDFHGAPAGGTQVWMRGLVDRIRAAGSTVHLGEPVTRVVLEKGRAAGIETASGGIVKARWVLAACDLQALYERLLPKEAVPAAERRKQSEAELYYSYFTVFLGLACPASRFGFGQEITNLTRDGLPRAEHSSGKAETSAITILAPTERDPTLAPAGKGILTIHCPAWLAQHDSWKTTDKYGRHETNRRFKRQFAQTLIDRVEVAMAPGLRDQIAVREIATPVTYWRYTGNRAGSIMGQTPSAGNIGNRVASYRTPVPGLLLAGHWAEYGGGLPIAVKSAVNTSLLILKQENRAAFEALVRVVDGEDLG